MSYLDQQILILFLECMNINDIKVDSIFDINLLNNLNEINLKENRLQNKVYLKKFLNDVIKNYAG